MFNKAVFSSTLTSEVADRLFSNITSDAGAIDQSFLATLRALLRKRLPANENVMIICNGLHYSGSDISSVSAAQSMAWFVPDGVRHAGTSDHRIFIEHTTQPNAGELMLETIRANAGTGKRYMSNFTRRDDLQVFYARKVKALFYTDDTEKTTVIFVDNLELKHFHTLQMMIPKYLPRLFKDHPLTEVETTLLKSLGNKSAVEYEMLIENFAKELDLRAEIIRSKLAGFETVFERLRADELRNEIQRYQEDYDSHLSMMRELSNSIQECKYTLAGIECAINDHTGDSELMEYFMCNKNLSIIQVRGTSIEFIAHGYADIYDEEAFARYARNHKGYLYSSLPSTITKQQMEKLYRAIFGGYRVPNGGNGSTIGNNGSSSGEVIRYKLRICAAYKADMKTGLSAYQHYTFPTESMTYFPNTHIQHYGCIGTYSGRFQEYMRKRDYVGAIDQAVVSARNLNFHDSTVMSAFAREFSHTTKKCIEKPDGALLAPLEAIRELEQITSTEPEGGTL